MRGTTVPAMLAAALLLAGCGRGGDAGGNDGAGNGDDESIAAVQPEQVPPELTGDPQNTVVPVALPSPSALAGLPPAFEGRWGMTPGDCDPARADAKGLMTIAGGRIVFAEARAVPSDLHATSPGRVAATLTYTGERETWRRATAFTLLDEGRTLVREEQDPAGSFRYSRCP